jgi:hypothetical protein
MNARYVLLTLFIGHWGTCPGLILVYSHLNYLIRTMNLDMLYVVGPGHGAPAMLAALWLEGSLERFYPEYSRNSQGLHHLISNFSTPSGFPRSVFVAIEHYRIPLLICNTATSTLKLPVLFMKEESLAMLLRCPLALLWISLI